MVFKIFFLDLNGFTWINNYKFCTPTQVLVVKDGTFMHVCFGLTFLIFFFKVSCFNFSKYFFPTKTRNCFSSMLVSAHLCSLRMCLVLDFTVSGKVCVCVCVHADTHTLQRRVHIMFFFNVNFYSFVHCQLCNISLTAFALNLILND